MTQPEDDTARQYADEDADRLTALVLDVLGSVLAAWRAEAARRLEVDAPSLACLDLVRRHGHVSPALVMERTGLTRSAVSKMVRRLEGAGHVELLGGGERGQALEIGPRPHAERDAERARMLLEVRRRVRWTVVDGYDEQERAAAIRLLNEIAGCVHGATVASVDQAAEARRLEARRLREAGGEPC